MTPHFPLFTPSFHTSPEVNSTTTSPIRDLFFPGYSTRRQLHAGIRLIPTLSILMKLQGWRSQILDSRLLHNRCLDSKSVSLRILGSTPATRRYKVCPYPVNTHGVTGWRSQRPNGRILYNHGTDSDSVPWRLLGSTPATRRYKVRPRRTKTHELLSFVEGVRVALAEFYLMADSSTTAGRIPILFSGGC